MKILIISLFSNIYIAFGFRPIFQAHRHELFSLRAQTEAELGDLLEQMLFSGDAEGFARKRMNEVLTDEFTEFVENQLSTCEEEDEKEALNDVLRIVSSKLKLNDGLGDRTELIFESRLDKILFTSPNRRLDWLRGNENDLTPGFVDYIQQELRNNKDQDSKLVLASVLQQIGQIKDEDYIGSSMSSTLTPATSQSEKQGLSAGGMMDRNEQILAGLLFSDGDPLQDILDNIQYIDDEFLKFLERKVESAQDMEERVGLKSLLETINAVLDKVKVARGEGQIEVRDDELNIEDVKARMQEVQMGKGSAPIYNEKSASIEEFKVKQNKRDTFLSVLSRFENLPEGVALAETVQANYELCDKEFMDNLSAEIADCQQQGADVEAQLYSAIKDEIMQAMASRMQSAQDKLAKILEKGKGRAQSEAVLAMESEIVAMSRRKELDEALVLLMEANLQQAQSAGATPIVAVFQKLLKRVKDEREKLLPDDQKLLRQLLRLSDSEERKGLLYQAFKPSKTMNDEGEFVEGPPLVTPPRFIGIVREIITSFGNVEQMDIRGRALVIVEEAQLVATELYGEGMTPRDQQRFMFEKNTLSVWDLAKFEEEATMTGQAVPWLNDKYDNMDPEQVLGEKVRRIGGSGIDPSSGFT